MKFVNLLLKCYFRLKYIKFVYITNSRIYGYNVIEI